MQMKLFQELNQIVIVITNQGKFQKYWWGNLLTHCYEVVFFFWSLYEIMITDNALLNIYATPSRPYEKFTSYHFDLCKKKKSCPVENEVQLCNIKLDESFESNTSSITIALKPFAKLTLPLMFSNLGLAKDGHSRETFLLTLRYISGNIIWKKSHNSFGK